MAKTRIKCIFLMMIVTLNAFPQSLTRSVISVSGNSTIDNKGLLSYSVGEVISGCKIIPYNVLTQGFQQPSLLNFNDEDTKSDINAVEVYPNPVIKNLTIRFNIRTTKLLKVELFSGQGTLFKSGNYNISESGWIEVEMENFPCGLYLLHVYSTDKLLDRVFKIEKI